jgi:hypothetical protein
MHPIDVRSCLRYGRQTFRQRRGWLMGIAAVPIILGVAPRLILQHGGLSSPAIAVGAIVNGLVSVLVSLGTVSCFLKVHEDVQAARIADLWHPRGFVSYLCVQILIWTMLVIVAMPLLAVMFVTHMQGGVAAAIVITALALSATFVIRYNFASILVVERGCGAIEALQESAKILRGQTARMLAFSMAVAVINLLGVLCFGVGVLVTVPISVIAWIHAFRQATGRQLPENPTAAHESTPTLSQAQE